MKNILIPTDFSDNGADAYAYALDFVGNEEARFHIINVVVPMTQSMEYPSTASIANQTLLDSARNNLETLEALEQEEDFVKTKVDITTKVLLGRVAESIVNEAKRIEADLIIMGTTGKGKSNLEKFLGSASSDVISNSEIPVLLVPKDYKFKLIDNLVYATDLDKSDLFHIWKLSKLLHPNTSIVRCLHVIDKNKRGKDKTVNEFAQFLKENSSNIQTHFHIEYSDDVEDAIGEFADDYDAEMIVMHRSAKNFWFRMFGTRHTKRMAYNLEVPLLIV